LQSFDPAQACPEQGRGDGFIAGFMTSKIERKKSGEKKHEEMVTFNNSSASCYFIRTKLVD